MEDVRKALTEKLIEKYQDKLDWNYISKYQNLSEKFILKHLDKIKIDYLVYNKKIKLSSFTKLRLIMKYPHYKEEIIKIKEI